jgi:septal ring factor EnvC (AmiA/AmiB activator)
MRRTLCLAPALLLAALFSLAATPATYAQSPNTQQELNALQEAIRRFETDISTTQSEEQDALRLLEESNAEIGLREDLIRSYSQKLTELDSTRARYQRRAAETRVEVEQLREAYKKRARHAYKRGGVQDLALVLASGSINEALVRARYLRRFTERRKRQVELLLEREADLARQEEEVVEAAQRIQELIADQRDEQADLAQAKTARTNVVSQLQRRRTELETELRNKQSQAEALRARMAAEIARAAEERRRKEREAGGGARRRATAAETGSFLQNRGQLPWPAEGTVTGAFGVRTHPVYGTKTTSPGIEMRTAEAAPVKSVFKGTVNRVFVMAGYGTCIMLAHGEYSTVYCNLSEVLVRQGQEVGVNQFIGRAGTAEQPLGPGLFFSVWDKGEQQDPQRWLGRR